MPQESDEKSERVVCLPIQKIHPFDGHPFRVADDDLMQQTVDSVTQYGVLNPVIVRPDLDGKYEMVSGHRRMKACELAGIPTLPAIVREISDDEAIILMVDSNLQREGLLPSERAFAYKMKLDAIKHQGKRQEQGSSIREKLRTDEIIARQTGSSRNQVQRYIRLTELTPELLERVDNGELALSPAVELSFLKKQEQCEFLEAMEYVQAAPTLSQAQRLKKLSQEGTWKGAAVLEIMSEEKKGEPERVVLDGDMLKKYFPKSYTPREIQKTIQFLLEKWQKQKNRQNML